MAGIDWRTVRSSNVRRVGWDEDAQELLIEFRSGSVYAYPNADDAAFQDLLNATSPGAYVARWLRDQPSRKVSG